MNWLLYIGGYVFFTILLIAKAFHKLDHKLDYEILEWGLAVLLGSWTMVWIWICWRIT